MVEKVELILKHLNTPFYETGEFWLFFIVGVAGVLFAFLAFKEAKKAKEAATDAGTTVKIQTITIELSEIMQRLDKLDISVSYSDARDLLNEISRRLRRLISPLRNEDEFKDTIINLINSLSSAKDALENVRPIDFKDNTENIYSVYHATESHFSTISGNVAELMGLCEQRNIETGKSEP